MIVLFGEFSFMSAGNLVFSVPVSTSCFSEQCGSGLSGVFETELGVVKCARRASSQKRNQKVSQKFCFILNKSLNTRKTSFSVFVREDEFGLGVGYETRVSNVLE